MALNARLLAFARARDWEQFHSPKNLSMALAGECGELLEHFQWLTEAQSTALSPEKRRAVAHELADILIYLIRLCERLEIDPVQRPTRRSPSTRFAPLPTGCTAMPGGRMSISTPRPEGVAPKCLRGGIGRLLFLGFVGTLPLRRGMSPRSSTKAFRRNPMTHRRWLPLALLALITGAAGTGRPRLGWLWPGRCPARMAPAQRPGAEAVETLKAGMDKLLAYLGQKDAPNKLQAAAFLDEEITPYFDFAYMAQWVAGPAWAGMSEGDRKAMAANIEASFLSSLANRMAKYDGQQVRYMRPPSPVWRLR